MLNPFSQTFWFLRFILLFQFLHSKCFNLSFLNPLQVFYYYWKCLNYLLGFGDLRENEVSFGLSCQECFEFTYLIQGFLLQFTIFGNKYTWMNTHILACSYLLGVLPSHSTNLRVSRVDPRYSFWVGPHSYSFIYIIIIIINYWFIYYI